jgi:hypothetical protein
VSDKLFCASVGLARETEKANPRARISAAGHETRPHLLAQRLPYCEQKRKECEREQRKDGCTCCTASRLCRLRLRRRLLIVIAEHRTNTPSDSVRPRHARQARLVHSCNRQEPRCEPAQALLRSATCTHLLPVRPSRAAHSALAAAELHGQDEPTSRRLVFTMGLNNSSFVCLTSASRSKTTPPV